MCFVAWAGFTSGRWRRGAGWGGGERERSRSGGEEKLLAEGNERQVGILMSASCFEWKRKHESVCSPTDVTAAKNNRTLWLNGRSVWKLMHTIIYCNVNISAWIHVELNPLTVLRQLWKACRKTTRCCCRPWRVMFLHSCNTLCMHSYNLQGSFRGC